MKTWEMIKKLTENPEKKFKNHYGKVVKLGEFGDLKTLVWSHNNQPVTITNYLLEHKWEEAKEPVSFMEALELLKNGKIDKKTPFTLVGKPGYERERLDNILERLTDDYYADGIAKILLEGKFYIED